MSIALVTGTAQGVGRAIAERLHADGYHVVMADIAVDRNEQVRRAFDPEGSRTETVTVDLRDPDATLELAEGVIERLGHVDVLVNNAAVAYGTPLWDVSIDEWQDVLDTNLRATFVLSRAIAVAMRDRGHGRIVNMTSLSAQMARPSGAHYAASKAGIIALTRIFARELAAHGVTVNAVAPGPVETPMMNAVPADVIERLIASVPVGRISTPEDIAALVAFLASDGAGFITGATYDINGGVLMR